LNEKNCKLTGIHEPILHEKLYIDGYYEVTFVCRWCHRTVTMFGELVTKPRVIFNKEDTYLKIVKYYIDIKHYSKEQANAIATKITEDQMRLHNK